MVDLFEVMSLGHVAIAFVDGGAMVSYLDGIAEDGDPQINRKIFTDDDGLSTFIKAYARQMFEGSETIEDALKGKRKK